MELFKMGVMSSIPEEVLDSYADLGTIMSIEPISMGLINKTYLATSSTMKFIVQEVSPIFDITINYDSDAVSKYLIPQGIMVPKIYRTKSNDLFVSREGRIFRALQFIDGESSHTVKSLAMAESAGRVVGEFHRALIDFNYDYQSKRRHGGDYVFHRDNLIKALTLHAGHDYYFRASPLAENMIEEINRLTAGLSTTARHVHGDPKISNIIFKGEQAICLVDFDTLGKSGWSLEIADALRSWCNPNQEDVLDAYVDLAIAEKALFGYGSIMRGPFSNQEAKELLIHSQAITLCLAMRYLADVLNESYFLVFDHTRFERAADHNLLRAQAMYNLFIDFRSKQQHLKSMVDNFLL